jgi:sugar lactone lactonase YvrE
MKKIFLLAALTIGIILPASVFAAKGDTTTFIGTPMWGNGKFRTTAIFDFPEDIAVNTAGEFYIADTGNNAIRKIDKDGIVQRVAGTGAYGDVEGARETAQFGAPSGVAERKGVLVVADTQNNKIKKIKDGKVTTIASGLKWPDAVEIFGDTVYFTDTLNHSLKSVNINGGRVNTITSSLNMPRKFALSSDGKEAYVADIGAHKIMKVELGTKRVSTFAGTGTTNVKNGSCAAAEFQNVTAIHRVGKDFYVSDGNGTNDVVRKIDMPGCTVSTVASDVNMLSVNYPEGLTSFNGKLYVVATGIGIVQQYSIDNFNINEKFAGEIRFNVKDSNPVLTGQPKGLVLSKDKKWIYFSENNRIRKVRISDKKTELIAGSVVDNYPKDKDDQTKIGDQARFSDPLSIVLSKDGESLYVVDRNNNRIREVDVDTGETSYLTGAGRINDGSNITNGKQDGKKCKNEYDLNASGCAYFTRPIGGVLSEDGKYLYVADSGNNLIRRVTVTGSDKGTVTTVAGTGSAGYRDGVGKLAAFDAPIGLAMSPSGKMLYIADRNNRVIRQMDTRTKQVSTLVGRKEIPGYAEGAARSEARLGWPTFLSTDSSGNIYFTDSINMAVRRYNIASKRTELISGGTVKRGYKNGNMNEAKFDYPIGTLVVGKSVYVADRLNDTIRKIDLD